LNEKEAPVVDEDHTARYRPERRPMTDPAVYSWFSAYQYAVLETGSPRRAYLVSRVVMCNIESDLELTPGSKTEQSSSRNGLESRNERPVSEAQQALENPEAVASQADVQDAPPEGHAGVQVDMRRVMR
jgi:hypothetical protein